MTTYFISGHLDLTDAEFQEHYVPRIDAALAEESAFVVGDARGCDRMAQLYLREACDSRAGVPHVHSPTS